MSELLLINPRRRKRRKSARKTVTGRRNPRRMSALQAKYFGGGRKRRGGARRRRRTVSVSGHRNPIAVASRRTRRSGRVRSGRGFKLIPANFIKGTLMPAAIGGAGALAVDVAWAILPIPAGMKTGALAPLFKIAGALGVGALASMIAGKAIGEKVVGGYLTVTAYNFAKDLVGKALPQIPLGEYGMGYYAPGYQVADQTGIMAQIANANPNGVGSYVSEYDSADAGDSWS